MNDIRLREWQQPMGPEALREWAEWAERQDTATLLSFWLATGHRQRFTRAACLRMFRERLATYERVKM